MLNLNAYYRLMRFDKPIGIILLWIPTALALWIANHGAPKWPLIIYFFLGTVIMRAAGCIVNDMADRNIDKHVTRTALRPITAGEVGLFEASILLLGLLFLALIIVIQLPKLCFYEALIAVLITGIYPFCKRFINAPQCVLGIAFSLGIPMAYAASGVKPNFDMALLCILNIAWIIAYDTMYAMVDREDDVRIGVRSTAILFANYDCLIIGILQIVCHGLLLYLGFKLNSSLWFYVIWSLGFCVMLYQQRLLHKRSNASYFKAFSANAWYGILVWIAFSRIICS